MTNEQMVITFVLVTAATVMTRFLPYVLFPEGRKVPSVITYLGKVLGPAVFGLLVVYCLRNVSITSPSHGIPELIACLVTIGLYVWKRGMVLPMAGGTIVYMILLHTVF
ncbi:MAG: AzlD domain-containing protein [Lachnospiraceae bacterium]|jgi:branched-subunit amino acid transport protein AzlD|nr:AzlD domain-containing protein [Lachnospiraceae bacterium]MCH4071105.1 AzlD domain-containing protein [Lachnospiraceae bacterium]MCH4108176.1 AzlD domain-containing protein [Lachnospiraceae bacterium]MCI1302878.1 AzlD domain-containing protein [Lachnospiraceae bacterium]MCI1332127.1 AzlD domain-containing protein [Lachnospiraceae bacterium]